MESLLQSYERCMTHGSKIIITSQSEKVVSLGTTEAVWLKCLPREAYWYFFKTLVFRSTDPEEHPKLTSIAMELALECRGSFICAYIGASLLRANLSTYFWLMVLKHAKKYMQKNLILFGEYPDDLKLETSLGIIGSWLTCLASYFYNINVTKKGLLLMVMFR